MKRLDLSGRTFGRWTVTHRAPNQGKKVKWHCRCECGKEAAVFTNMLTAGKSASCGCQIGATARVRNRTHGMTKTPVYHVWHHAKMRCTNPSDPSYDDYGGRGIRMAEEWLNAPADFIAYMGPRPPGGTLERKDVNGNYEPGNVEWASYQAQANNKRNNRMVVLDGERMTMAQCARRHGLKYSSLNNMVVVRGFPVEVAVTLAAKDGTPHIKKGSTHHKLLP